MAANHKTPRPGASRFIPAYIDARGYLDLPGRGRLTGRQIKRASFGQVMPVERAINLQRAAELAWAIGLLLGRDLSCGGQF